MKRLGSRRIWAAAMILAGASLSASAAASDHLDTSTVIEDPTLDIGDLYAWTSGDRVHLVMTIVGHSFSPKADYVFHVASGPHFGVVQGTSVIRCRFPSERLGICDATGVGRVQGDPRSTEGLQGPDGHMRVFAGLRDDPFYNNVRGSRDAYQIAAGAIGKGATRDPAGCPQLGAAVSKQLLAKWRQTEGGPGKNFLAGWTPASLVVSVEKSELARHGPILAVWAATVVDGKQTDRMGRPLTGNALMAPLAADEVSDTLKEKYNAARPDAWRQFAQPISETLGLYDSFDGICGNQLLADRKGPPKQRYQALARLLADDRLWLNSAAPVCRQFFAVELAAVGGRSRLDGDCGGRTPNVDAVDVYRSLLAAGAITGVSDGVDRDEKEHSEIAFPFLAGN